MTGSGPFQLHGRHALVTGASRGIGRAIALALAGAGARVTALARNWREPAPEGQLALSADVTDTDALSAALSAAVARNGPVAILVNNAGGAESAPFLKSDEALLRRMLALNLESVFALTRMVAPSMVAEGRGRIVNIASTAGLKGYAYVSAYVAAKHALVGLTRALAQEVATKGVTVNAVCPGFTDTDIVAESIARIVAKTGRTEADARAELAKHNPQQRLVRPEEVAQAVLMLCAPGAAAINGQAIAVDGGET